MPRILPSSSRVAPEDLARLVGDPFPGMVKFVVDLRKARIAIGGELHADAEALLIEEGSAQEDLWGGNYFPGKGPDAGLEFTSLINIRPSDGNPGMEILDPLLRERVREIVHALVGRGEALP